MEVSLGKNLSTTNTPQFSSVWMDIGNGVSIKKFGRMWTKIHEQNMSINRFNMAQTPDMKVFYSQSFDAQSSNNMGYLTSRLA